MIMGLLHRTITIQRPTSAPDGQGGYTSSPSVVGTVRGRVRAASASEVVQAGQRGYMVSHVVYAAAGADIRRGDTLEIDGDAYTVQWVTVVRGLSPGAHHVRAEATAVQHGG